MSGGRRLPPGKEEAMRVCPICRQEYGAVPALSRKDNRTEICPICAASEAMDAAGISDGTGLREDVLNAVRDGYAANGILVPEPGRAV